MLELTSFLLELDQLDMSEDEQPLSVGAGAWHQVEVDLLIHSE